MAKKSRGASRPDKGTGSDHDGATKAPSPETVLPGEEPQPESDDVEVTLNTAEADAEHRQGAMNADTHDEQPTDSSVHRIKASQTLTEMVRQLPTLQEYVTKAESDVGKMKNIWQEGTGKPRLTWGERETLIMLACILQVEEMAGEPIGNSLVDVKKGKLVRVPVKSVDNSLSKTVQTYIAWVLRLCGNPLFSDIDHAQVKNRWVKLKEIWDAISTLSNSNRSGAPFIYDIEHGFAKLDQHMAAEFDALAEGKVAKGHALSHLVQDAKTAKEFRNGPWVYYKPMAMIFEKKGGSSTVKGTYALEFLDRNKRKKGTGEEEDASGEDDRASQGQGPGHNKDSGPPIAMTTSQRSNKHAKSTRQSQTISAIGEIGEGNKALGTAFTNSLAQESKRLSVEEGIMKALRKTNEMKQSEFRYQKQCAAAQAISDLQDFKNLPPATQFAVQDWILKDNHAEDFLKVIPSIRGVWLVKQLGDIEHGG